MDPNQYTHIEGFVKGMVELGNKIKELEPDHIVAPMIGAVPFVDVLCLVDENFENEKVSYLPASNKIKNIRKVIRNWFDNFLKDNYVPSGVKIVSLDEVVSGSSLIRVYKQAQAAIQAKASKEMLKELSQYHSPKEIDCLDGKIKQKLREDIARKIVYKPLGVVDTGLQTKKGKPLSREYQRLIDEGKTDSVPVPCIPTMDRLEFFPLTYHMVSDHHGKHTFYPVVKQFTVSPQYIEFLRTVAGIVGKNPEDVTLRNMGKILDSSRYLSEEFKKNY